MCLYIYMLNDIYIYIYTYILCITGIFSKVPYTKLIHIKFLQSLPPLPRIGIDWCVHTVSNAESLLPHP